MSEFETAVSLVHDVLARMRDSGNQSAKASTASIARLLAAPLAQRAAEPQPPVSCAPVASRTNPAPVRDKTTKLAALRERALVCQLCPHLARTRTQVVFGTGSLDAKLMFVGEAPGEDEDRIGEPFVGKAGQLLTKIIETMGFTRGQVYIANVLKCRPDMAPGVGGNRRPTSEEMATCRPYLTEQIELIRPKVLVALGAVAMEGLLSSVKPMRDLRGIWHSFQETPLMATYHPAYLLRNQSLAEKRKVWEDMLLVLEKLDLPITAKQRNFFLSKE